MLRTALVLTALLIFPGIALAQEEAGGEEEPPHTVERGESLWNLARQYYDDGFQWRRIFEANEEKIDDPHWIYPGQELFIPGVGNVVVGVEVEEAGEPPPEEGPAQEEPMRAAGASVYPGPGDPTVFSDPPREDVPSPSERTTFYGALTQEVLLGGGVLTGEAVEHLAVSQHDFYSAPWRVPEERQDSVSYPGVVEGRAGAQAEEEGLRTMLKPYDRVELSWVGERVPDEGSHVHLVRLGRSEEGFGTVVEPTGLARVVERGDSALVAVVLQAYLRPRIGDFALPAEPFPLEEGQYAEEAPGDRTTSTLVGFATPRTLQQIGDFGFLSSGARDGIRVGDVFSLEVSGGGGWSAEEAVRYRVIRVFEDRASVRVSHVNTPIFRTGVELRRIRRMP